jgi:hypothetical protein
MKRSTTDMTEAQINQLFGPQFEAGLIRLQRFNNPEPRDTVKIFEPIFRGICNAAKTDPAAIVERIGSWDPKTVTMTTLQDTVRSITAAVLATDPVLARAKQRTLELTLELESPGSDDRSLPLESRSRLSLRKEISEGWRTNTDSSTKRAMLLEDELERRDAEREGRPIEKRVQYDRIHPVMP